MSPRHETDAPMTPLPDTVVRADPPFRTRCRTDGAGGLLTQDVMDLLRTVGGDRARATSRSAAQEICLATHPDEFVRWVWLGAHGIAPGNPPAWAKQARRTKGTAIDLRIARLRTALQEADAEGCVWTPVLDRLAYRVYRDWWLTESAARTDALSQSLRRRLDGLGPWIAACTDPADLAPLLEFETPEVRQVIARYASCLDVPWLRAQVGTDETWATRGVVQMLVENPTLSDDARAWVGGVVLEQFLASPQGPEIVTQLEAMLQRVSTHPSGFTLPMRRVVRQAVTQTATRYAQPARERAVSALLLDRQATAEELAHAMAAILPTATQRAAYWHHPHTPPTIRRALLTGARDAHATAEALLATVLTPADVEEILTARPDDTPIAVAIARARAGPQVVAWRRLARDTRSTRVKLALAQNPGAIQDAEVRATLLQTSAPDVLAALLPVAPAGEIRRIVRLVAAKDPEEALDLIRHLSRTHRRMLRRSDLIGVFAGCSGEATVWLLQELAVSDDTTPARTRRRAAR